METNLNEHWRQVLEFWRELESKSETYLVAEMEKVHDSISMPNPAKVDGSTIERSSWYSEDTNRYIRSIVKCGFHEPGAFVVCNADANLSQFENNEQIDVGRGVIQLVKDEKKFFLVFTAEKQLGSNSSEDGLEKSEAYDGCHVFNIGRRNWIHKNKSCITLYLDEAALLSLHFLCESNAENFQRIFTMNLETTLEQNIVCVHGPCPQDQLYYYNFLNTENSNIQLKIIGTEVVARSTTGKALRKKPPHSEKETLSDLFAGVEAVGDALHGMFEEMMDTKCKCHQIHNHLKQYCGLLAPLFHRSLLDTLERKNDETDVKSLLKNLSTFKTIIPFCKCGKGMTHPCPRTLMSALGNISALLRTCQRSYLCSNISERFRKNVINLKTNIESIFPLSSELRFQEQCAMSKPLKDLMESIRQNQNKGNVSSTLAFSGKKPALDLAYRMCQFLSQKDCDFVIFDKLDKLLRTGVTDSIFDHHYNNLRIEFQALENETKTLDTFCENVFLEDNVFVSNENNCSDWEVPSYYTDRKIDTNWIKAILPIISMKIAECMTNLRDIFDSAQLYLNFDITDWNKLWTIRQQISSTRLPIDNNFSMIDVKNSNPESETSDIPSVSEAIQNSLTMEELSLISWKLYNKYFANELTWKSDLGKGGYGAVSIYNHKNLGRIVVKEHHTSTNTDEIKKEIDMLIRLQSNANIVRLLGILYGSEDDSSPLGIIMEYIERNLHDVIHAVSGDKFKNEFTVKEVLEQAKGLANAFGAMHTLIIIHRDIKPENILLTYRGYVRICDVGTSADLQMTVKTGEQGSRRYMSPEMIESRNYDYKTDVYSLAITMWEMFHRRIPFYNVKTYSLICDLVVDGKRPEIEEQYCPRQIGNIIAEAWNNDPSSRPTMTKLEANLARLLDTLPELILKKSIRQSI